MGGESSDSGLAAAESMWTEELVHFEGDLSIGARIMNTWGLVRGFGSAASRRQRYRGGEGEHEGQRDRGWERRTKARRPDSFSMALGSRTATFPSRWLSLGRVLQLLDQGEVVAPWDFCHSSWQILAVRFSHRLCEIWLAPFSKRLLECGGCDFSHRLSEIYNLLGVGQKERAHPPEVAGRETRLAGELLLEVDRQPIDDGLPPALGPLALDDRPADVPIKAHQLVVDSQRRLDLGRSYAALEVVQQRGVRGRENFGGGLARRAADGGPPIVRTPASGQR